MNRRAAHRAAIAVVASAVLAVACGDDDVRRHRDDGRVRLVSPTTRPTSPTRCSSRSTSSPTDTGIEVELLKSQRRRHDAVEGSAHRRQPRGRRDVGRRQHPALAGDRRRRVRAVHVVGVGELPDRVHVARARRRGDTGRLRRRVRQLRHRRPRRGGVCSRRPRSTELAEPEYASRLVVENAATSSPGLAFLLATIAEFGDDGWEQYWTQLTDNGVARRRRLDRGLLRGVHAGRRRPAAGGQLRVEPAVRGALRRASRSTRGTHRRRRDTCFRQVEFAGVLRGTDARTAPRETDRLPGLRALPARGGAEPVRVPGQPDGRARPGVRAVRHDPEPTRSRSIRR